MAGVTDTQSLRFGHITDPISFTMQRNLADDIAAQLDLADAARTVALKRPVARVMRNAALAVPVSTITTVTWDIELTDTHAMVDLAGQPTRVTAGATAGAGVYFIRAELQGFYTSWTRGDVMIYKNGVFYCQKTWFAPQDLDVLQLTSLVHLGTVGDYVTVHLYHEGGGSTNTLSVSMSAVKMTNP